MSGAAVDALCVTTIRTLAMDAVRQANSGHPGTPMAMAPVAYALWQRHLRFDVDDPTHRVISMPSWELFDRQPREYRDGVLPPEVSARLSVEQATVLGWERYVGPAGRTIGMHTFGASAPLRELQRRFGFTPEAVIATARELVRGADRR